MKRVYFIKPIGMDGPIKIGCSHWSDKRADALATWSPFPLEVVAEIVGGFDLESRFHARFVAQHQGREWFRWSPELAETIEAVAAGTFDIDTLPAPKRLFRGGRTGPAKGTPWTAERRERAKWWRAEKRAEKASGKVRPPYNDVSLEDFLADPIKHGITPEEKQRQIDEFCGRWVSRRRAA